MPSGSSDVSTGLRVALSQSTGDKDRVQLRNVADAAGLHFVHQHSSTPEKHYVESAPGGLAVFDYNNDGRPDIFFTNGAHTPIAREDGAGIRQPVCTGTTATCASPT